MKQRNSIHVLFVCRANICRSPMAEALLKNRVAQDGLDDEIQVSSAATENWFEGQSAHFEILMELNRNNIPHDNLTSRPLSRWDGFKYDYIICMDKNVLEKTRAQLFPFHRKKTYLFNKFIGQDTDVDDPIRTRDFHQAYLDIDKGVEAIYQFLKERLHDA